MGRKKNNLEEDLKKTNIVESLITQVKCRCGEIIEFTKYSISTSCPSCGNEVYKDTNIRKEKNT